MCAGVGERRREAQAVRRRRRSQDRAAAAHALRHRRQEEYIHSLILVSLYQSSTVSAVCAHADGEGGAGTKQQDASAEQHEVNRALQCEESG